MEHFGYIPDDPTESPVTAAANELRRKLANRADRNDPRRVSQGRLPQSGNVHGASGVNLMKFPKEIIEYVSAPETGIQTRLKWPPSLAEIVDACVAEQTWREKVARYSAMGPMVKRLPNRPRLASVATVVPAPPTTQPHSPERSKSTADRSGHTKMAANYSTTPSEPPMSDIPRARARLEKLLNHEDMPIFVFKDNHRRAFACSNANSPNSDVAANSRRSPTTSRSAAATTPPRRPPAQRNRPQARNQYRPRLRSHQRQAKGHLMANKAPPQMVEPAPECARDYRPGSHRKFGSSLCWH